VITGLESNDAIKLDGDPVSLSDDGTIKTNGHLSEPGVHFVEAGGRRSTFEIVEPRIKNTALPTRLRSADCITLPQGRWVLFGAVPGETSGSVTVGHQGAMCKVDFDPVWAINVGAGPGAIVLSIKVIPPRPIQVVGVESRRRDRLQHWATQVYDAAVRRPDLKSLLPSVNGDQIKTMWMEYVRIAKQIKRQRRRSR
jgi:hypothetical protein